MKKIVKSYKCYLLFIANTDSIFICEIEEKRSFWIKLLLKVQFLAEVNIAQIEVMARAGVRIMAIRAIRVRAIRVRVNLHLVLFI